MIQISADALSFLAMAWKFPATSQKYPAGLYIREGAAMAISASAAEVMVVRDVAAPDMPEVFLPAEACAIPFSVDPSGAVFYEDGQTEFPDLSIPAGAPAFKLLSSSPTVTDGWPVYAERLAAFLLAFRADSVRLDWVRNGVKLSSGNREAYLGMTK